MKRRLRLVACMLAAAMLAGNSAVPTGAELELIGQGQVGIYEPHWNTFGFCGSPQNGKLSPGAGISWGIDTTTGTLKIVGKGAMYAFINNRFNRGAVGGPYDESPWAGNPAIKKVVISEGVTTIGYGAFSGCENLTEIEIPDSVVCIEGDAFWNTAWYKNQPDGMVYIGNVAYAYKGSLPEKTAITIKEGTVSICETAFIGDDCDMFSGEGSLKTNISGYSAPKSIINYGSSWGNAIDLRESEWYQSQPDGIVYANQTAVSIKGDIPESIAFQAGTIGISDRFVSWDQFGYESTDASKLKTVTIPESVQYIGSYAFTDCVNLSSVTIENPNCIINDSLPVFYQTSAYSNNTGWYEYIFTGTIYGHAGSTAEAFARKHGYRFRIIGTDDGFEPDDREQKGDFTEDGWVSVEDAQLALMIYTEMISGKNITLSENQRLAADINQDKKVDLLDAMFILRYYICNKVAGKNMTWEQIIQG